MNKPKRPRPRAAVSGASLIVDKAESEAERRRKRMRELYATDESETPAEYVERILGRAPK